MTKNGLPSSRRSDDGVALIAVLLMMFVGVAAVSIIASTVIYAIGSNVANKSTTQSFIAAESGRDAVLANVLAATCSLTASNPVGSGHVAPFYEASADVCPSKTAGSTFTITSTGYDASGATSKIVATYSRLVTYENQPGGSLAYFSGTFKLTKSTYTGDVVIRDGDYNCNSDSTIDGDLWVPKGSLEISAKCVITGSIYVRDGVNLKSSNSAVGKSVVAGGDITMSAGGMIVGVDLVSNGNITVDAGQVNGKARAAKTVDVKTNPQAIVLGGIEQNVSPAPAVFSPSLADVFAMTAWVDLPSTKSVWGADVDWVTYTPTTDHKGNKVCTGDVTASVTKTLASGMNRVGIDYSACTTDVTAKVTSAALNRDVLFLVPSGVAMNVDISGTVTSLLAAKSQFFFIHGDANTTNPLPNCRVGGSAGDDITLPATLGVDVMFYTACGISKEPNAFTGQYYAANDGNSHWVQPSFTCKQMKWTPVIDLGCKLGQSAGSGTGPTVTTIQKPVRVTQVEVAP
ncbi:hypothetical protein [Microbacterium sp. SS28]|uniref:hypothetical protein n=1 Tax=Microbacterium sp. SS28 TaxID=2919948 RepID=UPI001FAA60E0|nr:hypothetical protein [Microbacterium sp. SS28]